MTLVFIHGAGGSRLSWQLQLHHFKDAQAIGLSGHPDGQGFGTVVGYARSVEEFLERNAVKNPVLVGHSMGGAIAIEYALGHSDLEIGSPSSS